MGKKPARLIWSVGLVFLAFAAASCYEVDQEIVSVGMAEVVSGLPGNYNNSDGITTTISSVPYSNDYRYYRETPPKNVDGRWTKEKVETGTIRAIRLRGTIYLVQAKEDNSSNSFALLFYDFSPERGFKVVDVDAKYELLQDMARRHGVKLKGDPLFEGGSLEGKRENILAFLLAHRDLPFHQ